MKSQEIGTFQSPKHTRSTVNKPFQAFEVLCETHLSQLLQIPQLKHWKDLEGHLCQPSTLRAWIWLVTYLREVSSLTSWTSSLRGPTEWDAVGSHRCRKELQDQQGSQTGECGNGEYVSLEDAPRSCRMLEGKKEHWGGTVALETGNNDPAWTGWGWYNNTRERIGRLSKGVRTYHFSKQSTM